MLYLIARTTGFSVAKKGPGARQQKWRENGPCALFQAGATLPQPSGIKAPANGDSPSENARVRPVSWWPASKSAFGLDSEQISSLPLCRLIAIS